MSSCGMGPGGNGGYHFPLCAFWVRPCPFINVPEAHESCWARGGIPTKLAETSPSFVGSNDPTNLVWWRLF
eukprot:3654014-Karenia_brevis.AAC.1